MFDVAAITIQPPILRDVHVLLLAPNSNSFEQQAINKTYQVGTASQQ